MARPSNIPIMRPKRVRAGDPIRAVEYNALVDAVNRLIDRGVDEPPRPIMPDTKPPFYVTHWTNGSGDFKFTVKPGYVTWQNINGQNGYKVPTLGGTSLEDDTPPVGTLPASASYVYVRVATTNKGVVTGTPTIEATSSTQSSTHHVPPDPSDASGTAGDYYFLLAQFQDDGDGFPEVVRRIVGNRNVPNQLVELLNLGTGKEVYRAYLTGTDEHELRSIRQRASSPQINVKYDNEDAMGDEEDAVEILIEGNGNDGTLLFEDCNGTEIFSLTWVDGLITNAAGETIVVPDCPGTTT